MGKKRPYIPFFPNDWMNDMSPHPIEMQGYWMKLLCKLHWDDGETTLTRDQWSRYLGVGLTESDGILEYLRVEGVCDISVTRHAESQNSHENVTVINRRMRREAKDRVDAMLRKRKQREQE